MVAAMVAMPSRRGLTSSNQLSGRSTKHHPGRSLRNLIRPPILVNSGLTLFHFAKDVRRNPAPQLNAIGIFYSTSTGKTEEVADRIKNALGDDAADPVDIGDADLSTLCAYDGLIVGAPTWNTGADTERSGTAWDNVLAEIAGLNLSSQKVAVFGLGDQISYGDYYCDAMEELYTTFKAAGANMYGHWPTKGYDHSDSKAEIEKGKFCGLALDDDNQEDLTDGRVEQWVAQVVQEMGVQVNVA